MLTIEQKRNYWIAELLHLHLNVENPFQCEFHGLLIKIQKEVFCPIYGESSNVLAQLLPNLIQKDDRLLEIGTGSGVLAILAANQGASVVVATDISPIAIDCTHKNAEEHGLQSKIDSRLGDLFEPIKPNEKFSIIVFNPPFMDAVPKTWLERAMYDYQHRTLIQFFNDFPQHLTSEGKAIIVFSELGNMDLFEKLVLESKCCPKILKQNVGTRSNLRLVVYELTNAIAGKLAQE